MGCGCGCHGNGGCGGNEMLGMGYLRGNAGLGQDTGDDGTTSATSPIVDMPLDTSIGDNPTVLCPDGTLVYNSADCQTPGVGTGATPTGTTGGGATSQSGTAAETQALANLAAMWTRIAAATISPQAAAAVGVPATTTVASLLPWVLLIGGGVLVFSIASKGK